MELADNDLLDLLARRARSRTAQLDDTRCRVARLLADVLTRATGPNAGIIAKPFEESP